jgi:hypothetical protein
MLLNVNTPEARGVAVAFQSVTDDLGKGLGPVVVAALISSMGRTSALTVATLGWVPCSLLVVLLGVYIRQDESAMQESLASRGDAGGGLLAQDCSSSWHISIDRSNAAAAGACSPDHGVVEVRRQEYDSGVMSHSFNRKHGSLSGGGMDSSSSSSSSSAHAHRLEVIHRHDRSSSGRSAPGSPATSSLQGLFRHASLQPLVSHVQQSLSRSRQAQGDGEEEASQPLLKLQVVGAASQQHQQQQQRQQQQAWDV